MPNMAELTDDWSSSLRATELSSDAFYAKPMFDGLQVSEP